MKRGLFWEYDPTPLFDSQWYRETYRIPKSRICLVDYLERGHTEGREPSPYFDSEWYRSQVPALPSTISPLEHYIAQGRHRLLSPHPLFDPNWYSDQCLEFDDPQLYDFLHYITVGSARGLSPSPMFWPSLYRMVNPGAHLSDFEPLYHYLRWGKLAGWQGSPFLEPSHYAEQYPDDPLIATWGPISHFTHCGFNERATPSSDPLANHLAKALLSRAKVPRALIGAVGAGEVPFCDWHQRARSISLTPTPSPRVSVIIPTFNRAHDVIRCIESIAHAGDSTPLEVVLVDDASAAEHSALFSAISGITLVTMPENRGFAGAVEAGVAASSGEYVMLLNNDTEVLPKWLDALAGDLDDHPMIGVVGSMILQGDLTIQEVGAVVWRDGTAAHFGRGSSPMERFARRRRPVDYCSGASLLVRRSLWDKIGGFDPQFAPAYYEDTDLCLAARHAGYEVWVNPSSIILHREGSSYSSGPRDGKRRQFINRPLFAAKWEKDLSGALSRPDHYPAWETLAYGDRRNSNHVLVLDYNPVDPSQDSGSVRMDQILRALVDRGNVVHFMSMNWQDRWKWEDEISRHGVHVLRYTADLDGFLRNHRDRLRFIVVSRPECFELVEETLKQSASDVPVIYDMVDSHALRLERKAKVLSNPSDYWESIKFAEMEKRFVELADVTIPISRDEEALVHSWFTGQVKTLCIGNVHQKVSVNHSPDGRSGLLFVGGFRHDPNIDAVRWFVHEILPIIVAERPETQLTVVGAHAPPEIQALRGPHVDVVGWVDDLGPIYRRSRVAIAPLRYGAGVKGKVGEALSHGVPVVSTSIGAEGFGLALGEDLLVADSIQGFGDHVLRLLDDENLWTGLSIRGRERIDQIMGTAALHVSLDELDRQVRLIKDESRYVDH